MVFMDAMNFKAYVIMYHIHNLHAFIIVDLSYENLECRDIFISSNIIANEKFYRHE